MSTGHDGSVEARDLEPGMLVLNPYGRRVFTITGAPADAGDGVITVATDAGTGRFRHDFRLRLIRRGDEGTT